jgi:hypothetical protein
MEQENFKSIYSKNVAENAPNSLSLTKMTRLRRRLHQTLKDVTKTLGNSSNERDAKYLLNRAKDKLKQFKELEKAVEAFRARKKFSFKSRVAEEANKVQRTLVKVKTKIREASHILSSGVSHVLAAMSDFDELYEAYFLYNSERRREKTRNRRETSV